MSQPPVGTVAIATIIIFAVSSITHAAFIFGTIVPPDGTIIGSDGGVAGGDFPVFYNAGIMALKGDAISIWDHTVFQARLLELFGQPLTGLSFFNPPVALPIFAPFASMSYLQALWLWTALPLIMLGWLVYRLSGDLVATALSLMSPLAIHNAGAGQTGNLFAVLLVTFLLFDARRPVLAGSVSSLFIVKPHLVPAVPICLLIDRNWRALAAMVLVSVGLSIAVTVIFGFQVWSSFFDSVGQHSEELFRSDVQNYERSLSIVLLLLRLGVDSSIAWAIQVLVSLAALYMLVVVWRAARAPLYRSFALALAICLLTPKVHHYDAAILLVPVSILIAKLMRGTAKLSFVALAIAIWFLPLLVPVFKIWGFNPGGLLLFAGLILTFVKSVRSANG